MKKQILFLALLVVALFSSLTDAHGQTGAVTRSAPRPLLCTNDALHPIAGKPYQYTLDAAEPQNGGVFTWWATKNPNFVVTQGTPAVTTLNTASALTTTTGLVATSANYGAANASTTNTVEITWSSALLAGTQYQADPNATPPARTPTFVVAHYTAPATGCSDNLKVYELQPLNGFTVDILSLNPTDRTAVGEGQAVYNYEAEQCVDIVRGATYDPTGILYNYGTNVLYYEVVAANFSTQWTPHFNLTGLQTGQTADIVWSYDNTFATNVTVVNGAGNGVHVSPSAAQVASTVTNTSLGVSIYVRVTIHNNTFENITGNTINLAVAGQNNELLWDVDNNATTADCAAVTTETYEDAVDQVINPRPTVAEGTASVAPFTTNLNLIDPRP